MGQTDASERTLPEREALKYFLDILEKADLRDRIASMICPLAIYYRDRGLYLSARGHGLGGRAHA